MSKYTLKGSVSVHGIWPGGKFVAGQVIDARDYSPQLIKHLHALGVIGAAQTSGKKAQAAKPGDTEA